ncbi:asparagine synthase (glutamine-hydrolyzing) [Vibrio vulnificus]|uniref:asparagine synthase (glutamine-hydrolyzing) n=1 Tax=Vibrio vulnificus TaxID=672 RepID=UPI001A191F76|nr:asparagine synthase (glutamine-hydrolyzing) [Vibrio vulnificus]MCA0779101.1 asparagine synthase (glutamine-hydrolyzing) [Vibrio vulnificus]MCU8115775.1 asparagine synthase (glutamine-hydrolyzing) [Vibrio vulnificus]WIL74477.1 asparagine synthase (glutamine-hydrolyzing) [Vibrio vulnificus]HAS6240025.1 asparagine synthase (glutamine-hydrolyzing) [Vibrio vulnificus]HAS8169399.1 asparagine synthase (glutamine-hydrolyzing) [Vibrio vulnificus]
MCGILGYFGDYNIDSFRRSLSSMAHRGPDSQDIWSNEQVILGHRRLAIHDLTDAGSQPMISNCGRYVLVFNGEIYNYRKIKNILDKDFNVTWTSESDTEVLLNLIICYGIDKSLEYIEGMFAFCFYDIEFNSFTIARDRFGEKPIFYKKSNDSFIFSSELSCIEKLVEDKFSINVESVGEFVKYGFIKAPKSIYNEVNKLQPGYYATYSQGELCIRKYYIKSSEYDCLDESSIDKDQVYSNVKKLLVESIEEKMSSDVPLGAFLSGGIDSSLIAAIMQSNSKEPIKTFTIGFDVDGYNEAEFAREISCYLGTQHFEKYITAEMALNKINEISNIIDEPISDPSIIPTLFVSELAKGKVTVSLCGDGADEVFGGYKRYFLALAIWDKIKYIPLPIRNLLSFIIRILPTGILGKLSVFSKYVMKYGRKNNKLGSKLKKLSDYINAKNFADLYDRLVSHTSPNDDVVLKSIRNEVDIIEIKDHINFMMEHDQENYLPGDLLAKLDVATMHYSLEGRVPFLDSRLVGFVNSLPSSVKVKNGNSKAILKNLLSEYIPESMFSRPKLGFGVPIDYWLRNELKDWMNTSLDSSKIDKYGIINTKTISRWISEHLSEERNNGQKIWNVIVLVLWLENRSKVINFEK